MNLELVLHSYILCLSMVFIRVYRVASLDKRTSSHLIFPFADYNSPTHIFYSKVCAGKMHGEYLATLHHSLNIGFWYNLFNPDHADSTKPRTEFKTLFLKKIQFCAVIPGTCDNYTEIRHERIIAMRKWTVKEFPIQEMSFPNYILWKPVYRKWGKLNFWLNEWKCLRWSLKVI